MPSGKGNREKRKGKVYPKIFAIIVIYSTFTSPRTWQSRARIRTKNVPIQMAVERQSRGSVRMIIIRRNTDTRVRKPLFPPDAHISVHIIPYILLITYINLYITLKALRAALGGHFLGALAGSGNTFDRNKSHKCKRNNKPCEQVREKERPQMLMRGQITVGIRHLSISHTRNKTVIQMIE